MLAASLGWLGTAGTFVAYLLLWRGKLTAQSRRYALLNVTGGVLGGLASASYGAWPSVVSNVVWAAVGLHSVLEGFLEHRSALRAAAPVAVVLQLRRRLHGRPPVAIEADAA